MRSVVGVDVGGTFTDCVHVGPAGVSVAKLPTSRDQSEAVIEGTTELSQGAPIGALLHGSTVATNALLERRGATTVLVTDAGFEDVLEIGRQDRPSLYDTFADRPDPLVERDHRLGVRAGALDDIGIRVKESRPGAVAVSLAYSFVDSGPEQAVADALTELGVPVSLSSRVAPEFREFERASTTVLNAYLGPVVGEYLQRLGERAGSLAESVQVMRSSGGLMPVAPASELAAALLLSGPAGGVVAAAEMSRARRNSRIVTFDMGGTSTDVSRIDEGRPDVAYERAVDGYACRMPSVAVHTVGAGGGSIAWVDAGGSLRVGPMSAGADPGPAAYGRGGERATVTDAHVVLGRLDPAARLGGVVTLDVGAAASAVGRLGEQVGMPVEQAARGIVDVVEAHMERAIRTVSIEQGVDPGGSVLVAFGGAGGLHASSLARSLGMAAVEIPPYAGVFSALGLLLAPPRHDAARSLGFGSAVDRELAKIAEEVATLHRSAHGTLPIEVERAADVRYLGQSHEITVVLERGEGAREAVERFHRLHRELNGFDRPDDPTEVVTVRAAATGRPALSWDDLPRLPDTGRPRPRTRPVVHGDRRLEAAVWWRPELPSGFEVVGPAVIEDEVGTVFVAPDERASVDVDGTLEIEW